MSIQQITTLLEFCLTNTYFLFQGKYYEQVQGAAMGSLISPLIAKLIMKEFQIKALSTCPHPPSLRLRFVDDTFVITKVEHSQPLLHNINNQDGHIQFTVEQPTQQSLLPFLDTLVTIEPNNTFSTSVYRKPTHTNQYLYWDSNHHITAKQSVYNTLAHRAKIVSSTQDILDKELQHIRTALQACQFPNWTLNQLHQKFLSNNQPNNNTRNNSSTNQDNTHTNNTTNKDITLVVPYIKGISEKFKRLCKSIGIHIYFNGTNTLRIQSVNPKDKDQKIQKSGIIYHYKCPHINCPEAYIGESGREQGEWVKNISRPLPLSSITALPLDSENFSIIHKEVHSHSRTIKETIFIRVNDPTLNRNLGKYQLSHVLDSILQASPMLQLKPSNLPFSPTPSPIST